MNRTRVLLVAIVFELVLILLWVWLVYQRWQDTRLVSSGLLVLVVVLGLFYAFRTKSPKRDLAKHRAELARRSARLSQREARLALRAVEAQVKALNLKDPYTASHSVQVAEWATDIAQALELSEHQVRLTTLAGFLHDLGKTGVPIEILMQDPAELPATGSALLGTHCRIGEKILRNVPGFGELSEIILHHHEHYDGTGYPVGLVGEEIPLISRIISVADGYSAMVGKKPYPSRLTPEVAKAELEAGKRLQFDPQVVDAFLAVLEQRDEAYQRGEQTRYSREFPRIEIVHGPAPEAEESAS